jgi:tRNA dimethylallyltransferase
MIKDGLIEEVKYLLKTYNLSLTARQAIGYKEIIAYLKDEMSLDDAIALVQKRTRNYAKRQITFFKNQFDYLETVSSSEEILCKI